MNTSPSTSPHRGKLGVEAGTNMGRSATFTVGVIFPVSRVEGVELKLGQWTTVFCEELTTDLCQVKDMGLMYIDQQNTCRKP